MNINSLLDIASFSPRWLQWPNERLAHLPFSAWVIQEVSPKIFVEIGGRDGNSYFSFCQSVVEAGLSTKCYSIDRWWGDENACGYPNDIFAAVSAHNEEHYAEFSRLLRMAFDEALSCFSDESIGLLCVNGLNTYDSISHASEMWLPKLAQGAVVIFNDINVHKANFGVWKFWEELKMRYPNNLEFMRPNGLGILQLNNARTDKVIRWLQPGADEKQSLVAYFAALDSKLLQHYDLALLKTRAIELDKEIVSLNDALAERNLAVALSDQAMAEHDGQILGLNRIITKLVKEIKRILQSKSWKLTKPLRSLRMALDSHQQDLSDEHNLNALLANALVQRAALSVASAHNASENAEYVPLFKGKPPNNNPAKLICFYQPKFHRVRQNNECGNNASTEWADVLSTEPQSVGHYQPHLPCELGGYNPLGPGIQRRQIELAKLYGIAGFCFYFYWLGGAHHLEIPIQNYLKDDNLDLPFCLCWANENEQESDIADVVQQSQDGDIAFIQHISQYLRDHRYIRIDNKPLLLVYRPDLLRSAKETAGRWRQWCRDQGIGEIYLAYTQSFETVDPENYGFDAAIEFPPYSPAFANGTQEVQQLNGNLGCSFHDWKGQLEKSRGYNKPKYTLFRAVCPSWDNTARRDSKSSVLLNSSPGGYQEWLFNAIGETVGRFTNPGQRFIFINAWNEWAEGMHLEPDQRYGFSHLEATRMALVRNAVMDSPQTPDNKHSIAVVIHAFYETIFDEILGYLENIHTTSLKLYVTTPVHLFETISKKLQQQKHSFYALPVSNRGRDILPFIKIMPEIIKGGHDFLVKVHTKKSLHREDGDLWRKDVFEKLLNGPGLKANIDYLFNNPELGILGPTGHIVPMKLYMGSNVARITQLAARMGVHKDTLEKLNFVAGSMFIARTKAIIPLMNIALSETDFEGEVKQVDGTLAHALERLFSVSAFAANLKTSCLEGIITEHYQYVNLQRNKFEHKEV